jgi:GT2 family glycosyltransferase
VQQATINVLEQPSSSPQSGRGWPKASVIIVNWNGLRHLKRCLPSVFKQSYPDYEVLIVDNASTDGSHEYVSQEFPVARLVRNERNLGYAGANNVGFKHATGEYIAVLNPDTEVDPNWLNELVRAMEADPKVGLATPKILLLDDPAHLNACGNEITFTGLTFCRGLNRGAQEYDRPEMVSAVSGAAFVIRRSVLGDIGGFDDLFFMYYEDTDLSLRAMLAGYNCLYVPTAKVYHEYCFRFSAGKCLYQERNRYFSLLKTLRWPTLIVLTPLFALSEFIVWTYVAMQGREHMANKLRSYLWLIQNRGHVLAARQRVQRLRRVKDRAILAHFGCRLTLAQTTHPWLALLTGVALNPFLFMFGGLARLIVVW